MRSIVERDLDHDMREIIAKQLPVSIVPTNHRRARELATISAILDAIPEVYVLAHEDLTRNGDRQVHPERGRPGLTAEQVVRAAIMKQMNDLSYDELAFSILDSHSYRSFCRIGFEVTSLDASTLKKIFKRVRPETWETINNKVKTYAAALKVEVGEKIRTDCTVTETNIHAPTDSSLLLDCVRVLTRLIKKTSKGPPL